MSLKARLALGSAAAVAVAIVLASVIVYFLVRSELRAQVDRTLQDEASQIANVPLFAAVRAYPPNIYALNVPTPLFTGYFQLVGRDGKVYIPESFISSTPRLRVTKHVRAVAANKAHAFFYDTHLEGDDTRVYTMPSPGQRVAIQVVGQLSSVDNELSRIRLWLVIVAASGIGLAAGAGFLVARATLRPLRKLSETAERVRATRDLTQRIEVEGTDELATLARTFNAMLGSLDEAQQRQRQLVQDASHELRTPLTSLRTNIEVLATAGATMPPSERAHLLRDVIDQLGEMTELIGELTELARGEEQAEPLEDVRLDLLTEDAIRRTTRNHPEVPIEAELAPTTMVGQPASLERAIANLLDNAAKWSPAGTAVEVKLADGELIVRDHGPGIADEDVPHVFERFYRATSARSMPGSGLGLAIVQQVAQAHHGSVAVEEAPGGGTLIRLRLDAQNGAEPVA
jgi:two-component system, OmpR family, sensor histidine kinase MprB